MDEAAQVIAPAAQYAPAEGDERAYVREDGTLVIDIRVDPPCGSTADGEIVVCAAGESPYRYVPSPDMTGDDPLKPELQLGANSTLRARAETDPETKADRLMIDFVYKF